MLVEAAVDQAWRSERAAIVAALARRFRDLGVAEDATQEAFAAATTHWATSGIPDRPGAWLMTTAHRKAIGLLRRQSSEPVAIDNLDTVAADPLVTVGDLERDLFGLLLACCHPALNVDARIALTLRHVCGLTDQQIAACFVVAESTLTKRLVRARRKIKDSAISFEPPGLDALDDRLDDVLAVAYLLFTEGHLSASPDATRRGDLCDEAIWLTRQVHRLRPAHREASGLLALMLIQHARRDARESANGDLIRLAEQDRTRWDHAAIDEARELLATSEPASLGRFQVEAAIALLHVADSGPNWPRIADLYGLLARLSPSPVVDVNRAVAVGEADGAHAGLAVLEPIIRSRAIDTYPAAHAAHAHLLERAGRHDEAITAWTNAAQHAPNPVRRNAFLRETAPDQPPQPN